ncbi:hypothetical protein [Larkinella arboricola]
MDNPITEKMRAGELHTRVKLTAFSRNTFITIPFRIDLQGA